jgi:bifunctional DNA-binding transcriptional regulator/antitoxin component of YhaV-PrlF toxin-antitoxin module
MRISSKGQVTIPMEIRQRARLLPDTEVSFVIDGDAVRILRVEPGPGGGRGGRAIRLLQGSASSKMTTDQIMALTRDR